MALGWGLWEAPARFHFCGPHLTHISEYDRVLACRCFVLKVGVVNENLNRLTACRTQLGTLLSMTTLVDVGFERGKILNSVTTDCNIEPVGDLLVPNW